MSLPNARRRTRPRNGSEAASERMHQPEQDQGSQRARGDRQTLVAAQLMTAAELAQRWQVPKAHVYRLTRRGDLPVVCLGAYRRYRIEDIEEWERGGGANA